ncbi:Ribose import permease protein RbsC [Burkholderia gladioli]|nr:Ribose import permease protein RbsC [Burkholderia gladioli]
MKSMAEPGAAKLAAEGGTPPRARRAAGWLERGGLVALLLALVAGFAWREPAFIGVDNLFSILQAASIVALLAIGVTITLAVGGFDLSVGSTAATGLLYTSRCV